MKKINLYAIVLGFIFIIMLFPTHSMATKEDLLKENYIDEDKKWTIEAKDVKDAIDKLDVNNNNKLSVEELKNATDKELALLFYGGDSLIYAGDNNTKKIRDDSIEAIGTAFNERRESYGLSTVTDTATGSSGYKTYYAPDKQSPADARNTTASSSSSIDDAINDAEDFVSKTDDKVKTIETTGLQAFSNSFYNIFLTIGTAIAVIVGIIIGIQYMLGSVEEKAKYKELLVPYAVGCIVVFGSFGIWKMIIELMGNI